MVFFHSYVGLPEGTTYKWQVGGFNHFLFSIPWDNPNPIDELHQFSRWLLHHQPDYYQLSLTIY